jgi:hypothetical protein
MTDKVREALNKIASWTQTEGLLWWQIEARAALAVLDAPAEGEVWRDMDSAPKDGTKFDVWYFEHFDTPAHRVTDVYWSDVQDDFCTDGSYGPEEPTPLMAFPRPAYWHLIPSPPGATLMSGLDEKGLIEPCGGCGEADPAKRCLNCHHEFFPNRRASAPPAPDGVVERLRKHYDHARITHHFKAAYTIEEVSATLSAQEAEIERLRKELAEEQETWPKWAAEICKCLRGYGVDPGDEEGWDLPAQFEDWVRGVVENETARAESAEAEVARLESDISRANHALETALSEHAEMRDALTVEVARLRKVVERAKEVVAPFADISDLVDSEMEGVADTDEFELLFHDYLLAKWPLSTFRAARQFDEEVK